jgi:hypothetical protein
MLNGFVRTTQDKEKQVYLLGPSQSCCSLTDLTTDTEWDWPPPAAMRAAQPPVHAKPRPALQPFRSRPFRTAHSKSTAAHEACRWTMFNLNKAHICANHSRCAACQADGPAIPFPYSSPKSCSLLSSTPSSPPWLPPFDADLSSSIGCTEVETLSALSNSLSNPTFEMDSLTDSRLDPTPDCKSGTIDEVDTVSLDCLQQSLSGRRAYRPLSGPATPRLCNVMQQHHDPSSWPPTAPHHSLPHECQDPAVHHVLHEEQLNEAVMSPAPKAIKASSTSSSTCRTRRQNPWSPRKAVCSLQNFESTASGAVLGAFAQSLHDEDHSYKDTKEQADKIMCKSGEEDWHDVPLSADIKENEVRSYMQCLVCHG